MAGDQDRLHALRLRPALDLLAQVPALPDGTIVDLGCGSGAFAASLAARFPGRRLHGVDGSAAKLEEAEALGLYDVLELADIAMWDPVGAAALIFVDGGLAHVADHDRVLPALARTLVPGGVLAVQLPGQQEAPFQTVLRNLSTAMFPDRFDGQGWRSEAPDLIRYGDILEDLGTLSLWETTYSDRLLPTGTGHPVRHATQSTAARRVLERLTPDEATAFLSAYDVALDQVYPRRADGSVLFAVRCLFCVLSVASMVAPRQP